MAAAFSTGAEHEHVMTTFAESLGFKKGAMLPFASAPYALNVLSPTDPLSTLLQSKLAANVTANFSGNYPDHKAKLVPFSIMLLSHDPKGAHAYAGVNDTKMCFSASLLKPGVAFAAFELLAAANRIAAGTAIPTVAALATSMNAAFKAHLARYPFDSTLSALTPDRPQYTTIFQVNAAAPFVAFDDTFAANLKVMITKSGNPEATASIDALGFTYVNCALAAGGFFSATSGHHKDGHGIWISGDYGSLEARLVSTVNDGDGKLVMDTSTMCRLFALIELQQLVDATSSGTLQGWLAQTAPNDPPFITRDDHDNTITVPDFDVLRNKLGEEQIGRPATTTHPSTLGQNVFSECSVLGWKIVGPPATSTLTKLINKGFSTKVIVCWQNYQEDQTSTYAPLRQVVIDTVNQFAAA
ncbi:MAG TPA: hypothetical protein VK679_18810 [Gemmatimonadaceae bacterium]|nr:hypothetical protein [Gemmatimonadaceae bacterium]